MLIQFDSLVFLFWTVTYILIILYNIRHHALGIPPVAIGLNFGWETAAFVGTVLYDAQFHWGYFLWMLFDLVIVITYFALCKPVYTRHKYYLVVFYLASTGLFALLSIHFRDHMALFAFCIELIMHLEWFFYLTRKEVVLSPLVVGFCTTKLLGDVFAWAVFRSSGVITALSILILLLNVLCLYTALFRDQILGSGSKRR